MMKKPTRILFILSMLLAFAFTESVQSQKLDKFGSSITKQVGPKTIRVPYTDIVTYLGFAEVGSEDAVVDGKKFTYIYVWIPLVAPEIGVRMMSPVGDIKKIKDPLKAPNYDDNSSSKDYFDTYITFERSNIVSADNITAENVENAKWIVLDRNDDSGEMPKNPDGNSYNSLLRYKSVASNPLKALTVGLYRIGFTTYKVGEVKGTFIAQIAAPINLPGVEIVFIREWCCLTHKPKHCNKSKEYLKEKYGCETFYRPNE